VDALPKLMADAMVGEEGRLPKADLVEQAQTTFWRAAALAMHRARQGD
jgi:hypothetical protein